MGSVTQETGLSVQEKARIVRENAPVTDEVIRNISQIKRTQSEIESVHASLQSEHSDIETLAQGNRYGLNGSITSVFAFGTVTGGTSKEVPIFGGPDRAQELIDVVFINAATLPASGDSVNKTVIEIINKGSDGLGAAVLATYDSETDSLTEFVALVKSAIVTILPGEVLSARKTDSGTGSGVTEMAIELKLKPILA